MTEEDLFHIHSETKSLIASLIGIAIDEGFIKGIEKKVSDFFPQIKNDTSKSKITIKHQLDQTSGLPDYEGSSIVQWMNDANPTELILSKPLIS